MRLVDKNIILCHNSGDLNVCAGVRSYEAGQYHSDVSRTRNGGIPQLLPLLAHNVNLYAPTNTNHFKHWRTFGNLLGNIAMIKE